MKTKEKPNFLALLMALLFVAVIAGCSGGGSASAPAGTGTLSGSAK